MADNTKHNTDDIDAFMVAMIKKRNEYEAASDFIEQPRVVMRGPTRSLEGQAGVLDTRSEQPATTRRAVLSQTARLTIQINSDTGDEEI